MLVISLGCTSQTGNTSETSTSSTTQSSLSNAQAESYFKEGLYLIQSTGEKDGGVIILLCSPDSWNQPISKFEKALQINPNHEGAKTYLAKSWIQKGSAYNMCCFGKILNICGAFCQCNTQAEIEKSYSNALLCYNKAIEVDPKSTEAWVRKGDLLGFYSKYSEAITCYDNAIRIDPKYKQAWNGKGKALEDLRRYTEAISCYDKAIEIDPKYAEAWSNKCDVLYKLGRYSEAITCLDKSKQFRDNK